MSDVTRLSDIDPEALRDYGGKATSLAQLIQHGVSVPPGFVIGARVYREFLTGLPEVGRLFTSGLPAGELVEALHGTGWTRADTSETISAAIMSTPLPEAIAASICTVYRELGEGPVAVRSSATDEDAVNQSFAGQYDTFLGVEGHADVLDAVRKCWASVWSQRALTYRRGGGPADVGIAVIIQRFVPARVSGVMFTANPVGGDTDQILVDACWGLGEGVVSGRVTTDSFIVQRSRMAIVARHVRHKLMCAARGEGGTELIRLPARQREVACLSDAEILELSRIGSQLRELHGRDLDIEWLICDGTLHVLQARPITKLVTESALKRVDADPTEPSDTVRDGTLWSRNDTGEIIMGLQTPLGLSYVRYYQYYMHKHCLRSVGVWPLGDAHRYVGYVHGRAYLNISYLAYLMSHCVHLRDSSALEARFATPDVLRHYQNPFGKAPLGRHLLWPTLFSLRKQVGLAFMERAARLATQQRHETFERFVNLDLRALDMAALSRLWEESQERYARSLVNYFPFYFQALAAYDALSKLSTRWLGDKTLYQKLKADMVDLRTIDVTTDLWKVAEAAKQSPLVRELILRHEPAAVAGQLQSLPEGRQFWSDHVLPFLREHGVRSKPPEMEMTHDRWVDDPTWIFSMAKSYLENRFDVGAVLRHSNRSRDALTRGALGRLPFTRRHTLRALIALYYKFGRVRENNRMWTLTEIWVQHRLMKEIVRRLVVAGVLRHAADAAYVDFLDIMAYPTGRVGPERFSQELIDNNRREHAFNRRVPDPALCFIGCYDGVREWATPRGGDVLHGIGASPGLARGKARVITDITSQLDEFSPGEILVGEFTDVTWTPLFVTAAAVVTDIGSLLAHASIVAREFGIPAIVNTRTATQTIKTGDMLIVDGERGTVTIDRRARAVDGVQKVAQPVSA